VAKPKRARRTKTPEAQQEVTSVAGEGVAVPARKAAARRKKAPDDVAAPTDQVGVVEDAALAKPKRAVRKRAEAEPQPVAPVQSAMFVEEPVENAAPLSLDEATLASADGVPSSLAPEGATQGVVAAEDARERDQRGDRHGRRDAQRGRDRSERMHRDTSSVPTEGDEVGGEQGLEAGGDEVRPSRRAAIAAEQAREVFAELLSGDFDKTREEEAEETDEVSTKRILRPEPDAPKLQKVLAQAGVGSRRDIEQMIEDGRIEVNDEVAHIGQRISYGDRIKVAGRPIKVRISPPPARILAYHKPVGEVVTHDDPQGRPTVFRRLPKLNNGKWMSVGRLDLNTEGLLLFTNSGELANQLMHPRFGVEREYAVRVLGSLDEASRTRLLEGVDIEGQKASFLSITPGGGEGVNQWYRVVITEGRNREVRKLFDAVGLTVNRLIRVRYGAIVLPRGLKRGVWVELGESDVRAVKSLAGMDRQDFGQNRGGKGQQRGQQGAQQGFKGKQQGRNGRPQAGQGGPNGARPPRAQNQDRVQAAPRLDQDDDFEHIGAIPNPLEQTFDRRFAKGSKRITSGFGRPDQDQGGGQRGAQKGPKQPDPLQTSVGYIGADAYFGKSGGGGGGRRGRRR
jgi:23S rRNA pseudouridine2605 synthase